QQGLMYKYDPHLKAHMEEVREAQSRAATEPPAPPAPRRSLFGGARSSSDSNGKSTSNGAYGGPKGQTRPASGRVTQPGRPGQARKRSKKKR
ncbi:MAG TPA: hypothetical protein VHD87_06680, partial [Acidimicrobiales bacterium]|nr:hypothetical protein [Acidimicrobiales bacterium]